MMSTTLFAIFTSCGPKTPPAAPSVMSRQFNEAPQALAPRPFQLPEAELGELENGIPVLVSQNHEVPLVSINVVFDAGIWSEPTGKQNISVAGMELLDNGAGEYDTDSFAQRQRELATSISTYSGIDGSGVYLSSLKKNISESVDLASVMVQKPRFPKSDWEVEKQQLIQSIKASSQKPSTICANVFNSILYGGQYLGQIDDTEQIAALSAKDIQNWHSNSIVPANTKILVAGDITLEEILPILNASFGQWKAKGKALPDKPTDSILPKGSSTHVYMVDRPGAAQSVVRFGQFTLDQKHDDFLALEVANEAIGGMFIARLNMNLREDKGWTYGVGSWTYTSFVTGRWTISSNIITENTADAISEIRRELREAQEDKPITEQELAASKGNILGGFPQQFEQPQAILRELLMIDRYNLPTDSLKTYPDRVRGITLEQAQSAWNDHIDLSQLTIVVVGDASIIEPALLDQGLPVTRIDEFGKKITSEGE